MNECCCSADDVPQAPLDGEVTFIPHKKIIPAPKKPKKEPLGYTVTRAVWTAGNRVVYDLMYKDLLKKKLWKLAHLLGDATTSVAEWLWNVLVRNTTTWILGTLPFLLSTRVCVCALSSGPGHSFIFCDNVNVGKLHRVDLGDAYRWRC